MHCRPLQGAQGFSKNIDVQLLAAHHARFCYESSRTFPRFYARMLLIRRWMLHCRRIQGVRATRLSNSQQTCWSPQDRAGVIGAIRWQSQSRVSLFLWKLSICRTRPGDRGISRSKLVRVIMEKVVRDKLVPMILDDDDLVEPRQQRYRRFRDSSKGLISAQPPHRR